MKTEKEKLFEFAVIFYPTDEERKNGQKAEVVIPIGTMIAKDRDVVFKKVIKLIPSQYDEKLDQVDVAIRPF
jgi:hypothetical protein